MSPNEERYQGPPKDTPTTLEVQRKRAALLFWVLLLLTLCLLLVSFFFIPQASSTKAEVQGSMGNPVVKYLRGSAIFVLMVSLAWKLFEQAVRSLDYSRQKEKEYVRHLSLASRLPEDLAAARERIELIEQGSSRPLEGPVPKAPAHSPRRRKEPKEKVPGSSE
jgi:hypothetical protein